MIAEVCFTCGRHAQLALSTDSGDASVLRVWCVAPEDATLVPPLGVELWVRDFERNRNLNGWECVAGMLEVFQELFNRGAHVVVKRDSDTRVLDYAAFVPPPELCGVAVAKTRIEPYQFFGCGYSLSRRCYPLVRVAIDAQEYPNQRVPEDQFFSWVLRGHIRLLPHERGSFARNRSREREQDPLWINYGNQWEGDHWYAARAAAEVGRTPTASSVTTHAAEAPKSRLRVVATAAKQD